MPIFCSIRDLSSKGKQVIQIPRREETHHGQFSSVAQSCLTLCDPMDCSTPGLPVYHQLPEFTQTHVHQVGIPKKKNCKKAKWLSEEALQIAVK